MGLTPKQQKFIEQYFANGFNASKAALDAGYKTRQSGAENLSNPVIKAEIDRIFEDSAMPAGEILALLTAHARGDLGDFLDDNGSIDLKKAREQGKTRLIKKIKRTVTTYTDEQGNGKESFTDEIELHSPQFALQLLGKHRKLFIDRQEVEHSGAINLTINGIIPDGDSGTDTEPGD